MLSRQAFIALTALWALAAPAYGQAVTNPTPPNSVNGAYNASAPTCTDGLGCWLQTDVNGNLKTVSSGSSVAPIGTALTDRTVTSATGASQTVMAANASRKTLTIVNTGNANCGINPTGGTAVIGGAGTITLAPLGSYTPRVPSVAAITAICTAAQPLYADEG